MSRGLEAACWGAATRDAEIRTSKSGNEFAIINLMTQDGSTGDDGKPGVIFAKVLAFSKHVTAARLIKKGDRVYVEGQLSASIWKTNDGEAKLDLTLKGFKLERTGIGKNRPPRDSTASQAFHAPIERAERAPEFNDKIGF